MKIQRKINVDCLRVTTTTTITTTIIINFYAHKIFLMYLYNIVYVLIFCVLSTFLNLIWLAETALVHFWICLVFSVSNK